MGGRAGGRVCAPFARGRCLSGRRGATRGQATGPGSEAVLPRDSSVSTRLRVDKPKSRISTLFLLLLLLSFLTRRRRFQLMLLLCCCNVNSYSRFAVVGSAVYSVFDLEAFSFVAGQQQCRYVNTFLRAGSV